MAVINCQKAYWDDSRGWREYVSLYLPSEIAFSQALDFYRYILTVYKWQAPQGLKCQYKYQYQVIVRTTNFFFGFVRDAGMALIQLRPRQIQTGFNWYLEGIVWLDSACPSDHIEKIQEKKAKKNKFNRESH